MYVNYTLNEKDHTQNWNPKDWKSLVIFHSILDLELYCLDSNLKEEQKKGGMEGLLLGGEQYKTESTRCLNRPSKKGDHKASNLDFGSCLKIITVIVSVYAKSTDVFNVHILNTSVSKTLF